MGKCIDLTGKRFGRLTAIQEDTSIQRRKKYWVCQCDCGTTKSVNGDALRSGATISCGCAKRERFIALTRTDYTELHKSNKRLSSIWRGMRSRCYLKSHRQFKDYGGRGITICDEWLGESGFANFVKWAKDNGYADGLTIDRIDVDGNYSPRNCRWITHKSQQNNRKNNRYIEYNGETKTLTEWCEKYGLKYSIIRHRLDVLGLPFEVAIKIDGLPRVNFRGRNVSIRHLAQEQNIDYIKFLHEILINGKSAQEVIDEQTRQGIKRMLDAM